MSPIQKERELRFMFSQWLNGTADEATIRQLAEHAGDPELTALWQELLNEVPEASLVHEPDPAQSMILNTVYQKLITTNPALKPATPVRTLPRWIKYAAAILIILAGGGLITYFLTPSHSTKTEVPGGVALKNDPVPSHNKGMLQLSNGQKIILDTTGNGQLAQQEGASVFKSANGQITYAVNDSLSSTKPLPAYNTVSTPKGGEYKVVLSDGTAVWLNAASSITFPTVFTGPARKVSITGEAYFEVAKSKRPFRVSVNNEAEVEVLGTHFNVNAYEDEEAVKTTLLEGKVRVINLQANASLPNARASLAPGMQATVFRGPRKAEGIQVATVAVDHAVAWKNGKFSFHGKRLTDAMKELARWYNIEIVYEKDIPPIIFEGKIDRNLKLSQVLNGLKDMGVRFNYVGDQQRLIISPEN